MNKKQFFQLIAEVKKNITAYTPEQRSRIYEKINKLSDKFIDDNSKIVSNNIISEVSDYLEEK